MAAINPYLNFGGNCEEAFQFYHSVFGGDAPNFMRFEGTPGSDQLSASDAKLIMHVALPIGHGTILMGSDRPATMGPVTPGDNVQISVQTTNAAESTRIFNGLAEGGQVIMPLQQTFWGANFGMLVDKFGIQWMVNEEQGQ